MNPWLQLLTASGVGSLAVVVVGAIVNRKNLGAQVQQTAAETNRTDAATDEIIANTARGLVADVQKQLDSQKAVNADLWTRIDELEQYAEDHRRVLQLHAAWDHLAAAKLTDCDPSIELPEPPPLTPPMRPRHRRPPTNA